MAQKPRPSKKTRRILGETGVCRICGHAIVHPDSRPGVDATLHTLPRVRDEATGRLKRKRSKCEEIERAMRLLERTPASFFRNEKAARAAARRLDKAGKRYLRGHGALRGHAASADSASAETTAAESAADVAEDVPSAESAA